MSFSFHEFITQTFPYFDDAYFIYYILDVVFIMSFLKIIMCLPSYMLGIGKRGKHFNV